jgi:hypothetical protein
MFDRGDVAVGNVRIDRQLRWRRNGARNRGACHCGNDGHHGDASHRGNNGSHGGAGNINIIRNDGSDGNVDIPWNAEHVGNVRNVRLRLKQHCFIVDSNVNVDVAHHAGRRCSNGTSVGIIRDRQSWGRLRSSRTNNDRIAHCGYRRGAGTNDAHHYLCAHCFIDVDVDDDNDDKPISVPGLWRKDDRLLK